MVCWTASGATGLRVARERPKPPIVAITPNISTGRRLSLVWGVHCVVAQDARDQDDMVGRACRIALREGFAKSGQRVIIVAGLPLGTPGATNLLRIAYVGSERATPKSSAADLKFLQHQRQAQLGTSNRKAALELIALLVPLCFRSSC